MEHTLEISPSGRATCRSCKKKIPKGEVRFGELVKSQFAPEGSLQWHHLGCAAKKKGALVEPLLLTYAGELPDKESLLAEAKASAAKSPQGGGALPSADEAPTGRAQCIACREPIAKGSVRVAVEREIDTGSFTTKGAGYLHPACVAKWAEDNDTPLPELIAAVRKNTLLESLPAPF
jgi:hypothetical protein